MEETPKLLIFDRRTIAVMNAVKRIMDRLAGYSVAGGGISTLSIILSGQKINLLLPLITGMVGGLTLAIRELLSYLVAAAVIKNPINITAVQTISQPDPIQTPSEA